MEFLIQPYFFCDVFMKYYGNIAALCTLSFLSFFSLNDQPPGAAPIGVTNDNTIITISVVGDLMCHSPQFEYAKVASDSFDFSPTFSEIKKYFDSSDLTLGNLETVTAGKKLQYSGYPYFNSPYSYVKALKETGINFLFTSNNHCMDRGEVGILKTLENLRQNEINTTGTFSSQSGRDSIPIISVKGIRIALLAYTYGINGNYLPKEKHYLVNQISDSLVHHDIQKAKSNEVDVVVVYFHFGEEYQREPNKLQRNAVDNAKKAGADIILASHPHVLQPVEFFKSEGKLDSGIVAYSLGNFVSNQRWRYSDAGTILQFQIKKDENDILHMQNVSVIPTWVFKGSIEKKKNVSHSSFFKS